jgi:pimeloyl-ACP methyl ester carboxylesterase
MLPLKVVVLPARAAKSRDPVFYLSGGPGQAATVSAPGLAGGWQRDDHDVVLMDLRGTGEGQRLECGLGGTDQDAQSYLEPLFHDGTRYAECRKELERIADLTQYTTAASMRDLDELRQALGYSKINLEGYSYGTRAALTYIRMFGANVRSAVLGGISALENRAPLHHAAAAQRAFDETVKQCEAEAPCRAAYPNLHEDLRSILANLRQAPVRVTVRHPATGAPTQIQLTDTAFGDGLRVMLYSAESGRGVPLLLQRAKAGDLVPFAEAALQSSRGLKQALASGLLLSVSCSEDVWRIRPEEVGPSALGSFISAHRLLGQMAACSTWPRGEVPADYYRPFRSPVPILILSGHLDPVTPPSWGELLKGYFPNSVHAVLPGGHSFGGACAVGLARKLYASGSVAKLDPSCVAAERNPPFLLPNTS